MSNWPNERAHRLGLARRRHEAARRDPPQHRHDEVAATAHPQHQPAAAPVVGDEGEPRPARGPDRGQPRRPPVDLDRAAPAPGRPGAVERGQELGPPRAHDAGEPDDLARMHVERHVRGACQPARGRARLEGRAREPQQRLARPLRPRAGRARRAAARRGAAPARDCGASAAVVPGDPAVAHHRHAVGDLRHLLQPVRDVDDADAARREPPHDREQPLDLAGGQRRGRLVHDQHPRGVGERLDDRDHLPLPDREVADPLVGVDRHLQRRQPLLRRAAHRARSQHAARASARGRGRGWR